MATKSTTKAVATVGSKQLGPSKPSSSSGSSSSTAANKALQTSLNAKGANLKVDGIIGPLTKAAQAQYGGSSSQSSNIVNFNTATGKQLAKGESFVDPATGKTFKQGDAFDPKSYIGATDMVKKTTDIPTYTPSTFDAVGNLIGSQAASDYYTNVTAQQANVDARAKDTTKMYQDLFASIASPEQNLASAKQASGLDAAQQLANEENAKLQTIIKQGQANQLSVVGQGRGIPEAIIGGQQAQFARETAIQALPVQASLEAAQGNLAAATATFDKLFQAKQQDAQNRLQYGMKMIDTVSQFASEKDKIALDYVKQQEQRKYENTKSNTDAVNQIAVQIAQNGKMNSTIGTALSKIDFTSPTAVASAISIAGNSLVKPNQEIVKLDNGSVIVWDKNLNKIVSTIAGATGGAGGSGGATGGASNFNSLIELTSNIAGQTSVTAGKTIRDSLTTMLNKGDYAGAYAQVGNTVEEGLKGTTKTTFADSRTDSEVLKGLRTKIQEFADAGGNTGLLKGTQESISRKLLGVTGDPKLTALATALEREFQAYRVNMTGAAFSPKESRDYSAVNPRTKATLDLNLATIDGAISQLDNRVDSTIEKRIPGASDLRKLVDLKTTSVDAKSKITNLYQTAPATTITIIDNLFNKGYDDGKVYEYLQVKGLIK